MVTEYAKVKNYADAYLPWLDLYNNCPEMSKNTYKYGVMILNDFIAKETDATKKAEYISKCSIDSNCSNAKSSHSWKQSR